MIELHVRIAGCAFIALALVHILFPHYFNWQEELSGLSLINRQMSYVHTFFIALTVLLMGILCYTSANEMVHTHLGKRISLGLGIFWLLRLLIQFFGYSRELWRGKRFETMVHIVFSVFWTYASSVFLYVYATG